MSTTIRALAITAVALTAVAGLVAPAAAAPDPFSTSTIPSASAEDKNLPKQYKKFIPLKVTPTKSGSTSFGPLPSGCGLYVILTRSGTTLHSSMFTECLTGTYALMRTWGDLYRSRWYGWQNVKSGSKRVENQTGVELTFDYNCSGSGTHDFKLVGSSFPGQALQQSPPR